MAARAGKSRRKLNSTILNSEPLAIPLSIRLARLFEIVEDSTHTMTSRRAADGHFGQR
jgi:hypothetical protein